ncbi:MAG: sugar dehydrogenase complex small subunit [Zymomonas mobilis]|uniref:D-sorbitol dehydrogenase-like protein n=1 Tax=Zymomonas mobilis TaxID=542 RepID=A0A542W108_ZYMMB|nr:sugar dehydrogenase complex small subunit [Zymomonas mobilis]TQL17219.1 D-sorbitol dehydrogenase-like protein [Zymomonas mobilis]
MPEYPKPSEKSESPRRQFLKIAGLSAGSAIAAGSAPLLAESKNDDERVQDQFYQISTFLTGHSDLDRGLSNRALAALTAADANFTTKFQTLQQAILTEKVSDPSLLRTSPIGQNEDLMATAKAVVSAWYLGYAGEPAIHAMEDNAHFITYSGALMYRPTMDATVIPSYARGAPSYWVNPPASIKQD